MVLEKWTVTCKKKMKLDYFLIPYIRINWKWIKKHKWKYRYHKTLRRKYTACSLTLVLAMFIWICLLRQGQQKWDPIKLKSFGIAKETFNKTKWETTNLDKIFANDKSAKGLISQIYKELTQLNIKKKKPQIIELQKEQKI